MAGLDDFLNNIRERFSPEQDAAPDGDRVANWIEWIKANYTAEQVAEMAMQSQPERVHDLLASHHVIPTGGYENARLKADGTPDDVEALERLAERSAPIAEGLRESAASGFLTGFEGRQMHNALWKFRQDNPEYYESLMRELFARANHSEIISRVEQTPEHAAAVFRRAVAYGRDDIADSMFLNYELKVGDEDIPYAYDDIENVSDYISGMSFEQMQAVVEQEAAGKHSNLSSNFHRMLFDTNIHDNVVAIYRAFPEKQAEFGEYKTYGAYRNTEYSMEWYGKALETLPEPVEGEDASITKARDRNQRGLESAQNYLNTVDQRMAEVITIAAARETEAARAAAGSQEQEALDQAEAEVTTAPTPAGKRYTVKKGDSLSKIAKEHLGDANRWRELYEANKETIGKNPDKISVGMILELTGEKAKEAAAPVVAEETPETLAPAPAPAPAPAAAGKVTDDIRIATLNLVNQGYDGKSSNDRSAVEAFRKALGITEEIAFTNPEGKRRRKDSHDFIRQTNYDQALKGISAITEGGIADDELDALTKIGASLQLTKDTTGIDDTPVGELTPTARSAEQKKVNENLSK